MKSTETLQLDNLGNMSFLCLLRVFSGLSSNFETSKRIQVEKSPFLNSFPLSKVVSVVDMLKRTERERDIYRKALASIRVGCLR